MLWTFHMLTLQLVLNVIFFKTMYFSVPLYKGPHFIPDVGRKIASPPLYSGVLICPVFFRACRMSVYRHHRIQVVLSHHCLAEYLNKAHINFNMYMYSEISKRQWGSSSNSHPQCLVKTPNFDKLHHVLTGINITCSISYTNECSMYSTMSSSRLWADSRRGA